MLKRQDKVLEVIKTEKIREEFAPGKSFVRTITYIKSNVKYLSQIKDYSQDTFTAQKVPRKTFEDKNTDDRLAEVKPRDVKFYSRAKNWRFMVANPTDNDFKALEYHAKTVNKDEPRTNVILYGTNQNGDIRGYVQFKKKQHFTVQTGANWIFEPTRKGPITEAKIHQSELQNMKVQYNENIVLKFQKNDLQWMQAIKGWEPIVNKS